uniref:Uncharacterized protein n=1 Tax=Anguilla anguilla TaxID=7936 RepID=A0A0E9V1W9_ANGAN
MLKTRLLFSVTSATEYLKDSSLKKPRILFSLCLSCFVNVLLSTTSRSA